MLKLIATDMDGTLLDDNKVFNPNLFNIIKSLKNDGVLFAIASGRQYAGLVKIFDEVKNDILFICQNGGHIVYQGKTLYTCLMNKDFTDKVIIEARKIEDAEILACTSEKAYIENPSKRFMGELGQYLMSLVVVDDLTKVEKFIKVSLCDFKGAANNSAPIMSELFNGQAQLCISGPKWFDVNSLITHKGNAIKFIQQKFNISYEETMVFGDNFNDLEMFKTAYYSYAMENAIDEIKNKARFIASSNNNDGVITEILKAFPKYKA